MEFTHLIERDLGIDAGHRLLGHESKCARLHGHRYGFTLRIGTNEPLDRVGRVVDFDKAKRLLSGTVEAWDHRMLLHRDDHLARSVHQDAISADEIIVLDFNPTAENLAQFVAIEVSRRVPAGYFVQVLVSETPNCRATSGWVQGSLS